MPRPPPVSITTLFIPVSLPSVACDVSSTAPIHLDRQSLFSPAGAAHTGVSSPRRCGDEPRPHGWREGSPQIDPTATAARAVHLETPLPQVCSSRHGYV